MFTPPLIIGSNTFMRYFSSFDLNQEISIWAVTNVNDTTLTSLTDSLSNSSRNGFNLVDLNSYSGDNIKIAFRIRGLISKAFIDNLLVLDKYSNAFIPDSCFRTYLENFFPASFIGDSLNFLDNNILTANYISNPNSCMQSLEGLQYFVSLRYLNVANNYISYIPPDDIRLLDSANAENNLLTFFPDAPNNCVTLRLNNNLISKIPNVHNGQSSYFQFRNNLLYDCFMCSNRFIYADFLYNVKVGSEGCGYYNIDWNQTYLTASSSNLPAPPCNRRLGTILGRAFVDINSNNVFDTSDVTLKNQRINLFQSVDVSTSQDGRYSFKIDSGLVNMNITNLPNGFICNTPLVDTITTGEVINHDFIVTTSSNFNDMSV